MFCAVKATGEERRQLWTNKVRLLAPIYNANQDAASNERIRMEGYPLDRVCRKNIIIDIQE